MDQSRLLGILRRELETQRLQLSPYCRQQIESLINHGLLRVKLAGALDNPGLKMRAEQNLKELVRYFGSYARKVGSFPHLRDQDFEDALRNTPNLWPYCLS